MGGHFHGLSSLLQPQPYILHLCPIGPTQLSSRTYLEHNEIK